MSPQSEIDAIIERAENQTHDTCAEPTYIVRMVDFRRLVALARLGGENVSAIAAAEVANELDSWAGDNESDAPTPTRLREWADKIRPRAACAVNAVAPPCAICGESLLHANHDVGGLVARKSHAYRPSTARPIANDEEAARVGGINPPGKL